MQRYVLVLKAFWNNKCLSFFTMANEPIMRPPAGWKFGISILLHLNASVLKIFKNIQKSNWNIYEC